MGKVFLSAAAVSVFFLSQSVYAGREDKPGIDDESSLHVKKPHKIKKVAQDKPKKRKNNHRVSLSVQSNTDVNNRKNIVLPINWDSEEKLTFKVVYKDIDMFITIDRP